MDDRKYPLYKRKLARKTPTGNLDKQKGSAGLSGALHIQLGFGFAAGCPSRVWSREAGPCGWPQLCSFSVSQVCSARVWRLGIAAAEQEAGDSVLGLRRAACHLRGHEALQLHSAKDPWSYIMPGMCRDLGT